MKTVFSRSIVVAGTALIALAAYAAIQDVSLKRKPKVGETSEYTINASFTTDQGDISFKQKRVDKVKEVKDDGSFSVEATASETKISFGGQDLPDQPEVKATTEFGPDGVVRSMTGSMPADANSYRIANLHAFKAPDAGAKVGDEIKFDIAADSKKGTPAVKSTYKVAGKEKIKDWDTVKLTYTSAETEGETKASVKGTMWLSATDGSMVKVQEEWKDVQPTGAPFPVSGKYNIERTK